MAGVGAAPMPEDADTLVQALLAAGLLAVALLAGTFLLRRGRFLRLIAWLARVLPGGRRRAWKAHDGGRPFPRDWDKALRRNVSPYALLNPQEQTLLRELMLDFVPSREWVGHEGLTVNEEMKATIAAQACLLLLGLREHNLFAGVRSVIVHRGTFHRRQWTPLDAHGTALEDEAALLGEAWYRGPVLLSWREVVAGGRGIAGGSNVVLHEFAHQLDFQGQDLAELVSDEARGKRRHANEVMRREFEALAATEAGGEETLLDPYGATDPREFFAVATECFFEEPVDLEAEHPELYDVLRSFYGQDPAARLRAHHSA